MKISVSDDRPPIVPILAAGLVAGVVAVLAASLLGVAGMGPSNLRSLIGIGVGLLVGLLVKDRLVAVYEARWGGGTIDSDPTEEAPIGGKDPTGAGTDDTDGEASADEAGTAGTGSSP